MTLSFVSRPRSFNAAKRPGAAMSRSLPPPAGTTKPFVASMFASSGATPVRWVMSPSWSEREHVALLPAVGHDAERVDQALPAMEEHRHHAEIEQLVVGEIAPEVVVERPVDLPRVRREA